MGELGPVGPISPVVASLFILMTRRMRKAFKSLTKRHLKWGHPVPFTELEFFNKVTAAIQDGSCPYCFEPVTWDNFSPDHVEPLERGGSPQLSNIEIVCAYCNKRKGWSTKWSPKWRGAARATPTKGTRDTPGVVTGSRTAPSSRTASSPTTPWITRYK